MRERAREGEGRGVLAPSSGQTESERGRTRHTAGGEEEAQQVELRPDRAAQGRAGQARAGKGRAEQQ